jgi:hypothetical protein
MPGVAVAIVIAGWHKLVRTLSASTAAVAVALTKWFVFSVRSAHRVLVAVLETPLRPWRTVMCANRLHEERALSSLNHRIQEN